MLFNSIHFVFFFVLVTTLYFWLPHKFRWKLLLAASCYFYMTFLPIYILILGFTIIIDYWAGIWIENAGYENKKKFLVISIVANVGVLAAFKYFNFINTNISDLLNQVGYTNSIPNLSILLPIGLSFHTFQAMSYTIEVYRGKQKAERNLGIYALYVLFYPQLVAGPIERPQNILHQFYEKHQFDYERVTSGLKLMAWGLFKKVVVADRLALAVNTVYDNPTNFIGAPLMLATLFFAIQIYCDFSGYSDIAIGAARVMGFKLMRNFDRPYFAQSVSEFWTRWHISLSTWFRDYLYIPLGGNRQGALSLYRNVMITFLISGLWHGANWTYVIWGGINGVYLVVESVKSKYFPGNNSNTSYFVKIIRTMFTFILINISWIFFRAETIPDALYVLQHLLINLQGSLTVALSSKMGIDKFDTMAIFYGILILFLVELSQSKLNLSQFLSKQPPFIRNFVYIGLVTSILLLGSYDSQQQFIYFQF